MKYALLVAATVVALAGCNQQPKTAENSAAPEPTSTAPATPAAMVTANGSTPGTFEVTEKNGTKTKSVLNADGTYVDMDASGKQTAKGTWNVTNGKTCFDPDGDKGPTCYAETAVAADGTFVATPDKGDPVTVKKIS